MTIRSNKPDNAILLISDITKGMKSIGSKSLLPINKTHTIIEYQIQHLKKFYYPINIFISTGFEHDKIVKITNKYKNVHCVYNQDYESDNQSGSLLHCLKNHDINHTLVINNGLLLLDKISIRKDRSSIFITNKTLQTHFEIGINFINNTQYLFYDLPQKWLECVYFNNESITKILEIGKTNYCKKLFLFEMINILTDSGIKMDSVIIDTKLPIKINNIKDLKMIKKL
jgi:hypothetical protein